MHNKFQKQINDILEKAANKEGVEAFRNIAESIAIFIFELQRNGLSKTESLMLGRDLLIELVKGSKASG